MVGDHAEEPGRGPQRRPLRRDAVANSERLLAAAVTTLLRRGSAATLSEIAEEAGVGIGTRAQRPARAAVAAVFLGRLHYFVHDSPAVANGWFARARRLVADQPDCVEHEWRFADRDVEHWMAEQKVGDILDEFLAEIDTCRRAALLAQVISEDVEAGVEQISPVRIRGRMSRYELDDFDTWFAELADVWTHSFAIALAVLDGLPYEDVARAAEKLRQRLEPPAAAIVERGDSPVRDRHHFQPRGIRHRSREVWAATG